MDTASTPIAVFTHALNEGLSRAAVPRFDPPATAPGTRARGRRARAPYGAQHPVRAAPGPSRGPRRATAGGEALPDRGEQVLRRFTDRLQVHCPDAPEGSDTAGRLQDLARRALARAAAGPAPQGPTPAPPLPGPPLADGPRPDQLLAAGLLLGECALAQPLGGDRVARLLRAVRETFTTACGPSAPPAADTWLLRRAMARDVHDRIGDPLAVALEKLQAEASSPPSDDRLQAARRMLERAVDGTRDVVTGLHDRSPVPRLREALDDLAAGSPGMPGVDEARDAARAPETGDSSDGGGAAGAEATGPPAVNWTLSGDETTLPELFRRELLLVLRQAVRNALAHAAAGSVTVTVRITRRWAHAQVRDDGRGFDVDYTLSSRPAPGLRAMSERIESLGGRLAVTSGAGTGTRVDVHLPRYRVS